MKRISLLLIAMVALELPLFAADDPFEQANRKFASGGFKAAIADYESQVTAGQWSANLFYNLGNAYFREGDLGRAILNYERARQIDARHPEAEANLRVARDRTRGLELRPALLEKYVGGIQASAWVVAAAALFWLGMILLMARPGAGSLAAAIVCLMMSAGCAWTTWTLENGTRGNGAAIVVAENAEARVATADTARSILVLPAGSEVVILQQRGDWNYATLPNNQRGWIPAKAAETVRL